MLFRRLAFAALGVVFATPVLAETIDIAIGHQSMCTDTYTAGIIVKELMPNLLPYLMASLVGSVSAAILASIGLDILGLGVFEAPTLGMTLYWVNFTGAVINGWWWWWLAPIIVVAILFIALFLISIGLDEIANPRLRRQV